MITMGGRVRRAKAFGALCLGTLMALGVAGFGTSSPSPRASSPRSTSSASPSCADVSRSGQSIHLTLPAGFTASDGSGGAPRAGDPQKWWDSKRRTAAWESVVAYPWTGRPDRSDAEVLRDATFVFATNAFGPRSQGDLARVKVTKVSLAGVSALRATWTQQDRPTAEDPRHTFVWWVVPSGGHTRFVVAAHAPEGAPVDQLTERLGTSIGAGRCAT